jgi:hypothetical protein
MTLPFVIYRYVRGALLSTRAFWKISVSRPRAVIEVLPCSPQLRRRIGLTALQSSKNLFKLLGCVTLLELGRSGADLRYSLVSTQGLARLGQKPPSSIRGRRKSGADLREVAGQLAAWLADPTRIPGDSRAASRASASKLLTRLFTAGSCFSGR